MADYHFITHWKFQDPIAKVWMEIKNTSQWPEWWPYVLKVELIKEGTNGDIGSIRRLIWKTALPYQFSFETELIDIQEHIRIEGAAKGQLEGKGIWTFSEMEGITTVRYDWIVKTNKWWMNLLAPVARPLFEKNHEKVMAAGYGGLKNRLSN